MTRLYGWVKSGERVHESCPRNSGKNISLIGALTIDGLIRAMSIPGSVNTDVFLTYVREILAPQLWIGAVVAMDNLPVHQVLVIRETIEAVGVRVVFLPPYSPDLSPTLNVLVRTPACGGSPVEQSVGSKLKQCLLTAQTKTTTAINQALTEIINQQISSADAVGWFNHYGLFI